MSLIIIDAVKKRKIAIASLTTMLVILIFYRYYHTTNPELIAHKIYNILERHRILYDIDACSVETVFDKTPQAIVGKAEFINQIRQLVVGQEPINFLVVSFPFKSANHIKKTIGHLPDLAERRSAEYLQQILNDIKSVYAPGAILTIFCDGIPFAPFFQIPFDHVIAYEKTLQRLIADLSNIQLYTSSNFIIDHHLNRIDQINEIIDRYEPSNTVFRATASKSLSEITRKRFALELDYPAGKQLLAQRTLDDIVLDLSAREARLRNFLMEAFPVSRYIRLTVHFSSDISKKFGIRLSPDSCITPYHGVLVEEHNGSWSIQFKKDVDLEKYALSVKNINGIDCPYFKRN